MIQFLMFVAWLAFGAWMMRCLPRSPKQCFQCIVGRYIGLIIVLLLITIIPKELLN